MSSAQNKKQCFEKDSFPSLSANLLQNTLPIRKNKLKKDLSTISNYYINPQKRNSSQRQFKTNIKSLLQNNLPDIKTKKSIKRGSYLQMWLDQALDPNEPKSLGDSTIMQIQQTGTLRTLQRYQIDKKYLKSQNISNQIIDKLYHTLYVYTHGINQTFQEVINFSKNPQNGESKIINNFWRAFTKLIEGCTSFRTTFQIVQQNYKKYIFEMKQSFKKKQKEFIEIKQQLQSKIEKLTRKINDQNYQYTKLQADYKIAQTTLELTDAAFNSEVQMRLKFQEKVNAMFTAYEQIRQKYEKLIQNLNIKNEEQLSLKSSQNQLKRDLQNTIISKSELTRQLSLYQQTIKEKQLEIQLKRQQITQAHQCITALQQSKQFQIQKLKEVISKSIDYKQKYQNAQNQILIKSNIIQQTENKNRQKDRIIETLRASNQSIFQKYERQNQIRSLLQGEKIKILFSIEQLKKENFIIKQQNQQVKKINLQLTQLLHNTENKLQIAEDEIKIQKKCIQKNTNLIASLETVKNKFQKLYTININQKKIVQQRMNEAICSKQIMEQQFTGMKMLLQNRNKQIDEGFLKLQNQRQLFRKKIQGLKQEIQNKDAQILAIYEKNMQEKQIVNEQLKQFQKLKEDYLSFKQDKLKTQAQNFYLRQREEDLTKQRLLNRDTLVNLNSQVEEISKEKNIIVLSLSKKQYIINLSKDKNNLQNEQLRELLMLYRQEREKKASFIHPMLFQDQREQINRNSLMLADLKQSKEQSMNQIKCLKAFLVDKQKKIIELQEFFKAQKQNNANYQQIILELKKKESQVLKLQEEKKKSFTQQIIKLQRQIIELRNSEQSKQDQITIHKQQIKESKLIINKQQNDIARYKKGLNDFIQQIQGKNVQINQLKQQLSHKKPDIKSVHKLTTVHKKTSSRQSQRNSEVHLQTDKSRLQQIKQETQNKNYKLMQFGTNTEIKSLRDREIQTDQPFSHRNKFSLIINNELKQYGCQIDIENEQKDEIQREHFQPMRPHRQQVKQYKKIQGSQFKRALKITYMRR